MTEELPRGWLELTLAEVGLPSTPKVDPQRSKSETFELYSVPCFETGEPERALGASLASIRQAVEPGDVLLCKINPRINRVWVVGPAGPHRQIASTEWIVLRPRAMDPRFFMYQMREASFRERLLEDVSGVGGSLMRARSAGIEKLTLRVPPLPEQRRIVARIEALFARTRRARTDLDRIAPLSERYRRQLLESRFPPPANAIAGTTIADLLREPAANGISVRGSDDPPGTRSLKLDALQQDRLDFARSRYIDIPDAKIRRLQVRAGDFFVSRGNGSLALLARGAFATEPEIPTVFPDTMIRLRFRSDRVHPDWISLVWESPTVRSQIAARAKTTAGIWKVSQSDLETIQIAVPHRAEQVATAASVRRSVDAVAKADRESARALALLDRLEQSILARAFRGELVPQDAADEPASAMIARLQKTPSPAANSGRRGRRSV